MVTRLSVIPQMDERVTKIRVTALKIENRVKMKESIRKQISISMKTGEG